MSLTVQSIANDSAIDIRQVLQPNVSGADLALMTGWIDRIHKDCMHSSVYSYLNIGTLFFSTAVNTGAYPLNSTVPIRRIIGVFDYNANRILFPIERATAPVTQADKDEVGPGQMGSAAQQYGQPLVVPMSLQGTQPGYFRHLASGLSQTPPSVGGTIVFYPMPQQIRLIGVSYEQQVVTLALPTDVLLVPDDGRDMVVAGVNYLACLFLKRMDEAQIWAQVYSSLKKGESLV